MLYLVHQQQQHYHHCEDESQFLWPQSTQLFLKYNYKNVPYLIFVFVLIQLIIYFL